MDADTPSTAKAPTGGDALPEPHTQVTTADLHRLLETRDDRATLVLVAGRIEIDTGPGTEAPGLSVITRAALTDRVGNDPDDHTLAEQAAELNTEIRMLGA